MPYTYHENQPKTLFIRAESHSIEFVQLRGINDNTDKLYSYQKQQVGSLSPITGQAFKKIDFEAYCEAATQVYNTSTKERFESALNHLKKTISELK